MNYDPRFPTAVFLGPSLSRAEAKAILPEANYYPPVEMGQIYRLLGSGVRRIIVIDGVFHSATPVWQRELLAAIDAGIQVYGASSMGALRAAELHVFGMIGVGTIFEWYRDGVIDADDEVALMHGDSSTGYRALSEPLVNIRATLSAASEAEMLDAKSSADLLHRARATFYAERSFPRLVREAAEVCGAEAAKSLGDFVRQRAVNLKAEDARTVLQLAAVENLPEGLTNQLVSKEPPWNPFHHGNSVMLRGIPDGSGELRIATSILTDGAGIPTEETAQLSRDFFLARAVEELDLRCPDSFFHRFRSEWIASWGEPSGNGLRAPERDAAWRELATIAWKTDGSTEIEDDLLRKWASQLGISAPPAEELVTWMIAKGPRWFGYLHWNPTVALLQRRQLRNQTGAMPC